MIIMLLILLLSCSKTEVLNAPSVKQVDTLVKAHRDFNRDTINRDTSKAVIGFNPSVEDWNNNSITVSF